MISINFDYLIELFHCQLDLIYMDSLYFESKLFFINLYLEFIFVILTIMFILFILNFIFVFILNLKTKKNSVVQNKFYYKNHLCINLYNQF